MTPNWCSSTTPTCIPQISALQLEDTPFHPVGRKAAVRAHIANMLLAEMHAGSIEAVICRAPEFYGPGKTKSLTNSAVFDRIKQGKRPVIPVNAHTKRTLIWTPDASRAMGLIGNTAGAYGQTRHLPTDPERLTYAQIVDISTDVIKRDIRYITVPEIAFKVGGWWRVPVSESTRS